MRILFSFKYTHLTIFGLPAAGEGLLFIGTFAPNVTVIISGCRLESKGSDEIGRIDAKLTTTQEWMANKLERNPLKIQWKETNEKSSTCQMLHLNTVIGIAIDCSRVNLT